MKINYQEFFECKHVGDYGAVILITNEQIVETINLYDGTGNHNETIKKIIADIYETQNMTSKEIMYVIANQITIKLVSEHGIKLLAIEFPIGKKITSNQYNLFQKWCNRNRDIMKKISSNIYRNSNDYKLIVYAGPSTNGNYQEDDKSIVYQNDSLSSTQDTTIVGKTGYYITIPTLEEATFDLNNTLVSGYRGTDKNGEYYIEFTPTVNDLSKVIKYGKYQVNIKDSAGKSVQDPIDVNVNSVNKKITFSGLSANTLYYIELSYQTYRNNNGLTEDEKINSTPFTDFIYTPVDAGITLGTITAQQNGNKKVILAYNGASNMTNNIKKVKYTISQKGSSSKVQGEYQITLDNPNIFEISADKTPKLTLDFTDNNNGFSLKAGNTYIISTKYWYEENGKLVPLKDKVTDNDTFTAILNL